MSHGGCDKMVNFELSTDGLNSEISTPRLVAEARLSNTVCPSNYPYLEG